MNAELRSKNFLVVLKHIEGIDARVQRVATVALKKGMEYARTTAQREFLSGPRPSRLDVVTTRLRQSVSVVVLQTDKATVGKMGSNVKYAAYHEFGFSGNVAVKGFTRVINATFTRKVKEVVDGRAVVRTTTLTGRAAAKRQKGGFVAVQFVAPHSRRVDYPGKPFIKPALEKARPLILSTLRDELNRAAQGGTV